MLNQVILVGRIDNNPAGMCDEKQHNFTIIELVVPRSYKNEKGEYDSDKIKIKVFDGIAQSLIDYVHKGDLVGIKGRLENKDKELMVIAEKVTFLSSKKEEEMEKETNE